VKNLIICCDGTWNTAEQPYPSNVILTARTLLPRDGQGARQIVYYASGVGTYDWLDRLVGGAFGRGLERNVVDAYRFVLHNYEPGDRLYFFGFSRGAYTARSTVGMIRKCGILHREEAHRVPEAYALYRSEVQPRDPEAEAYRDRHSCGPDEIHFIGVWDTVGSRGIPLRFFERWNRRYQFHDVTLSSRVRNAFHALAIDEKRGPFRPAMWNADTPGQRVEQVWFAGVHCNVGGGYPNAGLSNSAFHWMVDRARECGLAFNDAWIAEHLRPNPTGELCNSCTGLYRVLSRHHRPIGRFYPDTEQVHDSAVKRLADPVNRYKPTNLKEYLAAPTARIYAETSPPTESPPPLLVH
jgi:uncharacterized protein (DUF2235 family)